MLALRAVRARAEYLEAFSELAGQTNPLGMTLVHKAQLETAIDEIVNDPSDRTNIEELDAITAVAKGTQH